MGLDRYPGKKVLDFARKKNARARAACNEESAFNDCGERSDRAGQERRIAEHGARELLGLPQENLLYFLEKTAPRLQPWQRELLRIVRHIGSIFIPEPDQGHERGHRDLRALPDHDPVARTGRISDGIFWNSCSRTPMSCFSLTSTIRTFRASTLSLGFAMMQDIERIVSNPDDEDRAWFPDIAGRGDVMAVLRDSGPITAMKASSVSSSARD